VYIKFLIIPVDRKVSKWAMNSKIHYHKPCTVDFLSFGVQAFSAFYAKKRFYWAIWLFL